VQDGVRWFRYSPPENQRATTSSCSSFLFSYKLLIGLHFCN